MATVRFSDVCKTYPNGFRAVTDFNLDIADKELVVFVGPSGCGKSTTMRMLAGLEEVSQGTVEIGERVVNELPPKDRDVAMVFQDYALFPHLTIFDNVAFGLRGTGRVELLRRTNEALELVGLYAEHKKIPLERASVALTHSRHHAEDGEAACDGKPASLERIDREITLEGDLDPAQRARMMEIADKCPVHRTLTSEVDICTKDVTS